MWKVERLAVLFVLVGFVPQSDCWSRRRRSPPPCTPRDCQVSPWSAWSDCTHQCGTSGTQTRTRTKTVVEACGGSCPFDFLETRACNRDKCQNSGTPIASGCLCQMGFSGTCCEIVVPVHYDNFRSFDNGNFNFSWMYNETADTLHFMLEVSATGWVGIGFSNDPPGGSRAPFEYDAAIGGVYNGTGYLKDYFVRGGATTDTQQDWVLTYSNEENGKTTLKFYRARNTTDRANDTAVPIGADIFVVWAYHSSIDVQPGQFPLFTDFGGTPMMLIEPTPSPTPACGGQLHGPNGSFSSPGFPQNYPDDVQCVWRVDLAQGSTLNITFVEFNTELCCDFLEIRNGSSLVRSYKGNLGSFSVSPLTASNDHTVITIQFISDGNRNAKGLKAHYTITTPQPSTSAGVTTPPPTVPVTTQPPFFGCGGMLNGSSGSFGTPGYPMIYSNNLDCTWTLNIPAGHYLRLKFIVFHTELCCDFVKLIDSAGQNIDVISGYTPGYTVTVDNTRTTMLHIRFNSDSSVRRRGFLAQYNIAPLPETSSPVVPSSTPVTALPTTSPIPLLTMSATGQPSLFSTPFVTSPATALPTFSSAPINTTVLPSPPSLTPVMSSSVTPPIVIPPDVQMVLVNLLNSFSQIMQKLTGLLANPITTADIDTFRNETLQILQQIQNQLASPSPTQQSSNQQVAKRAIPDMPNLQELQQMMDNIQRRLLG